MSSSSSRSSRWKTSGDSGRVGGGVANGSARPSWLMSLRPLSARARLLFETIAAADSSVSRLPLRRLAAAAAVAGRPATRCCRPDHAAHRQSQRQCGPRHMTPTCICKRKDKQQPNQSCQRRGCISFLQQLLQVHVRLPEPRRVLIRLCISHHGRQVPCVARHEAQRQQPEHGRHALERPGAKVSLGQEDAVGQRLNAPQQKNATYKCAQRLYSRGAYTSTPRNQAT